MIVSTIVVMAAVQLSLTVLFVIAGVRVLDFVVDGLNEKTPAHPFVWWFYHTSSHTIAAIIVSASALLAFAVCIATTMALAGSLQPTFI